MLTTHTGIFNYTLYHRTDIFPIEVLDVRGGVLQTSMETVTESSKSCLDTKALFSSSLGSDITHLEGQKEQPWRNFWPPSKLSSGTDDKPWINWHPSPQYPDEKPWIKWMNDKKYNPTAVRPDNPSSDGKEGDSRGRQGVRSRLRSKPPGAPRNPSPRATVAEGG